MSNSNIIKIAGGIALVSMLFLPMAGCGTMTFSGLDIVKNNEANSVIKILLIAAMVASLLICILKSKRSIFLASVLGIVLLVAAYIYMKSSLDKKEKPNKDLTEEFNFGGDNSLFNMNPSDMIELKAGAYLAVVAFLASAFVAKSKKELFSSGSAAPAASSSPGKSQDTNTSGGTV